MESQPQDPEFRNIPETFHPLECVYERFWYVSHYLAREVQESLHQCIDLPEPSLLVNTKYGCR